MGSREEAGVVLTLLCVAPVTRGMSASFYRGQVASPHTVTLVTLGDAAVGKTSLINRFCSDNFNENYVSTSFCRYVHDTVIGSRRVRFTIWDFWLHGEEHHPQPGLQGGGRVPAVLQHQ